MISVEEIVNDPEFGQFFMIHRHDGSFIQGVWTVNPKPKKIKCFGPVIAANVKEINQLPEGDRISGIMIFYTPKSIPLMTSHVDPGTSDEIYWQGELFKIVQVNLYENYGYYKGYGRRIKGA
jgi:hypothetical protein